MSTKNMTINGKVLNEWIELSARKKTQKGSVYVESHLRLKKDRVRVTVNVSQSIRASVAPAKPSSGPGSPLFQKCFFCFLLLLSALLLFKIEVKQRPAMEKRNLDLNKVAKITLLFWILKILATTLGEVLGDFFSMTLNIGYSLSLLITFVLFIIVLSWQLKQDRFHAPIYWLVIIGTTTVGTEISDLMDRTFGLGYALGASILFAALLIVLFMWHRHVKEIKVYPITERRVELYYWFAILVSNSLGTAFGDLLSDNLGLSYLVGAAITAGVIVVVVLLHYFTKINRIVLFWIAFIFTRPFGATFGDFLTKPISNGGMNFSRGIAALATAAIMCLLMYLFQRKMNKRKVSFA